MEGRAKKAPKRARGHRPGRILGGAFSPPCHPLPAPLSADRPIHWQVYQDYHAFMPLRRPRGYKAAAVTARERPSEDALSVLIVGADSVSRLNMIRKMPRTRHLLASLGAVEMLGYNKIEDNTFPNLVPLLTNLSIPELRRACWPQDTVHFDACPFVWRRFSQEGYVNMFAEDAAWMGLFHYERLGFLNQPTEYDPRPLLYRGEHDLGRVDGYGATK